MNYYYDYISGAQNNIIGQEIIDHTYVLEGVVLVEYANNVSILVNYNQEEVTFNETTVAPLSYEVIS